MVTFQGETTAHASVTLRAHSHMRSFCRTGAWSSRDRASPPILDILHKNSFSGFFLHGALSHGSRYPNTSAPDITTSCENARCKKTPMMESFPIWRTGPAVSSQCCFQVAGGAGEVGTADPGLGVQTVEVHLLRGLTEAHGVFPEAQMLWAPHDCPAPTKHSGSGRWRGRTGARHRPALLVTPGAHVAPCGQALPPARKGPCGRRHRQYPVPGS